MTSVKTGQIVWHDLFTADEDASKSFYEGVAGWRYVTEHATDFAWGGGERDFVLALSGDEAGAGYVPQNLAQIDGWVPYIEVEDVGASAARATELGATIEKPPFEVPGVGRNCLLLDPLGARVGIALSRHSFPVPRQQFGVEFYLTKSEDFPADFYQNIFGWNCLPTDGTGAVGQTITLLGDAVAECKTDRDLSDIRAQWLPSIRVTSLTNALNAVRSANGSVLDPDLQASGTSKSALVRDPNGALLRLIVE